jgi:hypothetical protein
MNITHNNVRMTRRRKLALESAYFYAKVLGISKRDFTLEIHYKFDYLKTFAIFACVDYHSKKRVTIEIDAGLSEEKMLTYIAHEMVHVKQYLKGQLSQTRSGLQLWKGKKVNAEIPYHRCPWELEAYKKQCIMYYEFIYCNG